MTLIQTDSRWGNMYRQRYYVDGIRASADTFQHHYTEQKFTAEQGVMEKTSFGYRKTWVSN